MCDYCEPSHGRKMPYFRIRKIWNDRKNRNYSIRIGKSWKGNKYKNHKLMLFEHGLFVATLKIQYCPFCGRKLSNKIENQTIAHLDWIITSLKKSPPETAYLDHEFFDETIVFTLEKAKQMRTDLISKGRER